MKSQTDTPAPSAPDWPRFVSTCETALCDAILGKLAGELGVSADALRRLRIGWSHKHRAFTFPMVDAGGRVLGVRLRGRDGRKWSVPGGREGLFVPWRSDSDGPHDDRWLIVCEGPTDCAALVDLHLQAIGRPSCSGGVRLIVELVQALRPADVAILADADTPGLRGANNLGAVLAVYVPRVRIATPPSGMKDARAWKCSGATQSDVLRRIHAAEPRSLDVVVKGGSQ